MSERQNCGGSGTPDPRQRGQLHNIPWKRARVAVADALRRALQVARARVISQSRPQMQHFVRIGGGQ